MKDINLSYLDHPYANRHSDIFLRIIHNICKIKLTLRYFLYFLECKGVQHSPNHEIDFHKQMITESVLPEKNLI